MIAAAVVVLTAALTAFLVSRGSNKAKAQPTRKDLSAAMVSIRQVRDAFGTGWNALGLTGSSDPFCPQFTLAEPQRAVDALYTTIDEDGSSNAGFYEAISSFQTVSDANKFYEQDTAISKNCAESEGHLGTQAVTYEIADVTRDADSIAREVVAIKYEATPTDGSSDVVLTGYIVETKIDRLVLSTNYYVYGRDPESGEILDYYDLTKIAFDKAAAAL